MYGYLIRFVFFSKFSKYKGFFVVFVLRCILCGCFPSSCVMIPQNESSFSRAFQSKKSSIKIKTQNIETKILSPFGEKSIQQIQQKTFIFFMIIFLQNSPFPPTLELKSHHSVKQLKTVVTPELHRLICTFFHSSNLASLSPPG